jgi:flagella basal body P-ring formation protein FlgA
VVRVRDKVTLAVRAGGLWVTAAGEALQSGRVGDTVSVRNIDSKKTVVGKVTGPGTVELELGGVP